MLSQKLFVKTVTVLIQNKKEANDKPCEMLNTNEKLKMPFIH